MNFLEKNLEDIIFESDRYLLEDRGLEIEGKLFRQLRIGNYGIADLVGIKKYYQEFSWVVNNTINPALEITVYKLKKNKIDIDTFLQAIGCARGIQRYLEHRNFKFHVEYSIVLIGKKIDVNSSFSYITNILPNTSNYTNILRCYTYDYEIDGIRFNEEYDYKLTNEGFYHG